MVMKKILLAAVLMLGLTGCIDTLNITDNPISYGPTDDHMQQRVRVNLPTAVLSSFDETSMGAALVRRLPNTTNEIQPNTKMVLIKGEDIMSRPFTEWLQAARIYLTGGYIAIEKPHDAHLVHFMEQMIGKMAQAEAELLTGDMGNGVTATIIPPDDAAAAARISSAHTLRLKSRVANLGVCANTRGASEAKPVAEMVIFGLTSYYSCSPYQNRVFGSSHSNSDKEKEEVVNLEYNSHSSGLMADGAAQWLNSQQKAVAGARGMTRADGSGAINQLMSATEEHTLQTNLFVKDWNGNSRSKENAYLETVRVWGSHNMDTNKDYYYVQQKAVASVGGKKDGDDRLDATKTLYAGPYDEDDYIDGRYEYYDEDDDHTYIFYHYYGGYFKKGQFSLGLTGNGDIKVEDAIPTTDNNNTSTSVAVGETHTETNTVGGSFTLGFSGSNFMGSLGGNYSHGWTDGTSYTMTTTTNVKEIKVTKNTDGNTVLWEYEKTKDVFDSDEDEHVMMPDAVVYDVNIDNQICWSVSNPEGAYTLKTSSIPKMQAYFRDDDDNEYGFNQWPTDGKDLSYELLIPNRATQTWRMDITFPEIGEPGHEGNKAQLIEALQRHFPDLYQPTLELADQTEESENAIKNIYALSQQLVMHSDGSQTMKEYAKDLGLSEYTILWYTTDGKHSKYTLKVTAE